MLFEFELHRILLEPKLINLPLQIVGGFMFTRVCELGDDLKP